MSYDSRTFLLDTPPFVSSDPELALHVTEQRRRRAMIYGGWPSLASERVCRRLGVTRGDALGDADLSSNTFAATMAALAVLYSDKPEISNSVDPSCAEDMATFCERAGLWPRMQRFQRDTLALREHLMAVDVAKVGSTRNYLRDYVPRFRPVFADLTELAPKEDDPERPCRVIEYRRRMLGGSRRWTKEIWGIDGVPMHLVSDGNMDVSDQFGLAKGGAVGNAYPTKYRRTDGTPVLPYVLYHGALTGCLLDSFYGIELVEGTLEVAVDWTYFHHVLRNAAFGKIIGIGCSPEIHRQENGRNISLSDPTVFHRFTKDEGFDGQPTVTMLAQSVDPTQVAEAVSVYERKLATFAGIDPSEFQKTTDPRSGYAIALSTEGKRQAALRYAPVFGYGDAELLALTAIVLNRTIGADVFPEDGWAVQYAGIGESLDANDTPVTPVGTGAPTVDVQATALNGAQSDAMGAILDAVATGTREKAVAIAQLQFVFKMSPDEAAKLIDPIVVSVAPAAPAAPAAQL